MGLMKYGIRLSCACLGHPFGGQGGHPVVAGRTVFRCRPAEAGLLNGAHGPRELHEVAGRELLRPLAQPRFRNGVGVKPAGA